VGAGQLLVSYSKLVGRQTNVVEPFSQIRHGTIAVFSNGIDNMLNGFQLRRTADKLVGQRQCRSQALQHLASRRIVCVECVDQGHCMFPLSHVRPVLVPHYPSSGTHRTEPACASPKQGGLGAGPFYAGFRQSHRGPARFDATGTALEERT